MFDVIDFQFGPFSAASLLNLTDMAASKPLATLGPTGDVGGQGHFGLYVNGHTNVSRTTTHLWHSPHKSID